MRKSPAWRKNIDAWTKRTWDARQDRPAVRHHTITPEEQRKREAMAYCEIVSEARELGQELIEVWD